MHHFLMLMPGVGLLCTLIKRKDPVLGIIAMKTTIFTPHWTDIPPPLWQTKAP
jgi:hypothetical protein